MTTTMRSLLPLAAVTAAVSVLTLYLLDANPSIGRWLLAALLFAHGWVHLMFVFPRPDPAKATPGATAWPFDLDRSWLVTRAGMTAGPVRAAGRALMAVTFVGFLAAALATAGLLIPAEWWPALVLASAGASTLLLGLWYSPTLLLGFAIDVALAGLVLSGTWAP